MAKKPLKLDRSESFGTVCGNAGKAKFSQHGLYFDADDNCITTEPESLNAAKVLIDHAANPEPDTQAVRYAHRGNGKYDAYNAAGEVVADNVELHEAAALVPRQFRDDLGTKARSDLVVHINVLGGVVARGDTEADLIDKIVEITQEAAVSGEKLKSSPASVPPAPEPKVKAKKAKK